MRVMSCWRPHFEGFSQLKIRNLIYLIVVEDPILRGYYNYFVTNVSLLIVVEGPILRGYHN